MVENTIKLLSGTDYVNSIKLTYAFLYTKVRSKLRFPNTNIKFIMRGFRFYNLKYCYILITILAIPWHTIINQT